MPSTIALAAEDARLIDEFLFQPTVDKLDELRQQLTDGLIMREEYLDTVASVTLLALSRR